MAEQNHSNDLQTGGDTDIGQKTGQIQSDNQSERPDNCEQGREKNESPNMDSCFMCSKAIKIYKTKCLTESCSNYEKPPAELNLTKGDHIAVPLQGWSGLLLDHHAIVTNISEVKDGNADITVIDVPQKDDPIPVIEHYLQDSPDRPKRQTELHTVTKYNYIKRKHNHKETLRRADEAKKAMEKEKEKRNTLPEEDNKSYHIFVRNCEHFVTECITGSDEPVDLKHSTSLQSNRFFVVCFHLFCIGTMLGLYLVNVFVYIGFVGEVQKFKKAFCVFEPCFIGKNNGFLNTVCDWWILLGYFIILCSIATITLSCRGRCCCHCCCTCFNRQNYMCNSCICASATVMFIKIICICGMEAKNFILERAWLEIYLSINNFASFICLLVAVALVESLLVYFLLSEKIAQALIWCFGNCCSCLEDHSWTYSFKPCNF